MSRAKRNLLNEAYVQSKGGWKAGQRGIIASRTRWQGPQSSRLTRLKRTLRREAGGFSITGGFDPHAGRKMVGLMVVGLLLFLAVSSILPYQIRVVRGEYDAAPFAHTRTPIFSVTDATTALWQYNSTCVNVANNSLGTPMANFTFTVGSAGSQPDGRNCNTADIILSKAPVSLQSASARELEILQAWVAKAPGIPAVHIFFFLRSSNGTLPAFNEVWGPEGDVNVRLLWSICPSSNPGCSTPYHYVFVPRDPGKSIGQEGEPSDTVISKIGIDNFGGISNTGEFAAILNLTGPRNFLHYFDASNVNASSKLQSQFDVSRSYYVGAQVTWRSDVVPAANDVYSWVFGRQLSGAGVDGQTLRINSMPAACSDQANFGVGGCPNPNIVPQFNINPLDPSTWVNAIVQGLLWVFTTLFQAAATMFGFIVPVIINALNVMGNFLGLGNIGTQIANFFNAIAGWITSVFGTSFAQAANILTFIINGITLFTVVGGNFFNGASQALTALVNMLGFLQPIMSLIILSAHMSISTLVVLWLFVGMLQAFKSFEAFMGWFRTTEMLFLKVFKFIYWVSEEVFKLIARLRTVAPRPLGV